ncbi:MAG: BON domain-containing protein [Desulfomonilaceae bacterium]
MSNGFVTLDGEVDQWFERNAADNAVRHLVGVKGLINKIQINPKATTADIKKKIQSALERNGKLDAKGVTVEIHKDKVILGGHVPSWADRDVAEWAAWAAPGVAKLENNITVQY